MISHGKADKSSFPNTSHFCKVDEKPREVPSDEMRSQCNFDRATGSGKGFHHQDTTY